MERVFLAKEKNSDDRDIVKYIEFNGFECGHYFGGLHIIGACFSGYKEELKNIVENDFESLETILTRDEFIKLFELDRQLDDLGFGIEKDSDRYNKGMEIIAEFENTIGKKLLSDENKKLFEKVVADEKEYVKNEYDLTDEEVEEIFDNYGLEYQDRAIVGTIFSDKYDMIEEEKFSFGYDKQPYFDDESFGNDLLDSESYYELESGRIVYYCY